MKLIGTQTIETRRLILRKITIDDAEDMYRNWASDYRVTEYLTWKPHSSLEETKSIIGFWVYDNKKGDSYRWCIEFKANGEAIGDIGVVRLEKVSEACEIGYCMSSRYWNGGIMTEALCAVRDYLFSKVELRHIEACHHVGNPASGRVMEKSGMIYEGIKRQGARDNEGNPCDVAVYSLWKSDWEKTTEQHQGLEEDE